MDAQELLRRREEKIVGLKTRRVEVVNTKLLKYMRVDRLLASEASKLIIERASTIRDPLIPALGGIRREENKFHVYREMQSRRPQSVSCCTIM
ncbi:hypothetical protein PUMCH_000088 [Australozyma saopauloensis]|uniref:Uncharacterized protein n=1 Tax=Australozyma saopauloensis TaxID=291208 RepID=A0AAX4H2Z3_9ASCO|nr:hypothetical protein PUMCH_000088 [[Candida] saopauloensis]